MDTLGASALHPSPVATSVVPTWTIRRKPNFWMSGPMKAAAMVIGNSIYTCRHPCYPYSIWYSVPIVLNRQEMSFWRNFCHMLLSTFSFNSGTASEGNFAKMTFLFQIFRICYMKMITIDTKTRTHFDGILPKGPYPPCLRMADRALLAGYHRLKNIVWHYPESDGVVIRIRHFELKYHDFTQENAFESAKLRPFCFSLYIYCSTGSTGATQYMPFEIHLQGMRHAFKYLW